MEADKSLRRHFQCFGKIWWWCGLGCSRRSGERKFQYVLKVETAGFTDGSEVDCGRRRVQDDSKVCLPWATGKMEGRLAEMGRTLEGIVHKRNSFEPVCLGIRNEHPSRDTA